VSLALTWPRRPCLLRVLLGTTVTVTSFSLSKHTGGGDTAPAFSSRLVVRDCPSPPFGAQGAPPSLLRVFFVVVVYYSVWFFFSFFPGWGSVYPGGYADLAQGCLWEYHVPLSSPSGLRLPKWPGSWRLAAREPSWFLCLM
jgi:hypothetical protein